MCRDVLWESGGVVCSVCVTLGCTSSGCLRSPGLGAARRASLRERGMLVCYQQCVASVGVECRYGVSSQCQWHLSAAWWREGLMVMQSPLPQLLCCCPLCTQRAWRSMPCCTALCRAVGGGESTPACHMPYCQPFHFICDSRCEQALVPTEPLLVQPKGAALHAAAVLKHSIGWTAAAGRWAFLLYIYVSAGTLACAPDSKAKA